MLTAMVGLPLTAWSQPGTSWRLFRNSDGLPDSTVSALSLSPRGNLLIKHGEAAEMTRYDGYTLEKLPTPGRNAYRVYESRSGQLWSLYREGIQVYDGSQWVQHPVPEIRAEIEADPLRQIRQISLVPADRDRVFFLVADRLVEFNAATRRSTLIRRAAETGLDRFFEMTETQQGGLWISGARGLAFVPGPVRRMSAETVWEEHLPPESLQVENLQRPFEESSGAITVLAQSILAPSRRVIVRFDGANWTGHSTSGEPIRQAWRGWDQTSWAYTINALLRFDPTTPARITREATWLGQYKDVAPELSGAFWLGTSEGLARYSPLLWRAPNVLADWNGLVHSGFEDAAGGLWFATSDGLLHLGHDRSQRIPWPEGLELNFLAGDKIYPMSDGALAIGAGETPLRFDPGNRHFEPFTHPEGWRLRLLGQQTNGALAFLSSPPDGRKEVWKIEQFIDDHFDVWLTPPAKWPGSPEFFSLLAGAGGDIWLAGSGGPVRIRDGQWQNFGTAYGFRDERAYSLVEFPDGRLWCGGSDGIYEFNGKIWTSVRSGLDRVTRLRRTRDGKVWASSNRGLHIFFNNSWMTHSTEEGLPGLALTEILEDRAGQVWVGGVRGLARFSPEADEGRPRTGTPRLRRLGKAGTEEATVIEFAGLDRWQQTAPERLLFSWRLDNNPWVPFTNTLTHTFEQLGSGTHRLEVRCMDRNWNEDPQSQEISFAVVVPWFREPRIIMVGILGFVLVFFFAALAVNRHLRLIRSYAEVEKIVALRTRELERANQELLHSQKMKALGTMAAGIAHDFNNILSIIKGSAQIIERSVEDKEKILTRVNRIKTVVEQGSGIVKSMLGLSRVSERDLALCDINELLEDIAKLLADRFPPELVLRIVEAPGLPPVRTVRDWLQQMLLNFVLNAVDALNGSGEVVLSTAKVVQLPPELALTPAPSAAYVTISVEDHGTGVPPDVLPRIFEPFFTTKALSSRRGTGLGLSMVYELAKELGYGLHVVSTLGRGSIFTIILPLAATAADPAAAAPERDA